MPEYVVNIENNWFSYEGEEAPKIILSGGKWYYLDMVDAGSGRCYYLETKVITSEKFKTYENSIRK